MTHSYEVASAVSKGLHLLLLCRCSPLLLYAPSRVMVRDAGRGFFADAMQQNKHAISGLSLCPEGLLVSTWEGAVLFYSLS